MASTEQLLDFIDDHAPPFKRFDPVQMAYVLDHHQVADAQKHGELKFVRDYGQVPKEGYVLSLKDGVYRLYKDGEQVW